MVARGNVESSPQEQSAFMGSPNGPGTLRVERHELPTMFLSNHKRPFHGDNAETRELRVRIRGGYSPPVLHARAGRPVRIRFLREETASCSEQVVFPAFGRSATLPAGRPVTVELPAAAPGRYEFTCAMNMLHGELVVEPEDAS